jgi:hypothetical protein
VLANADFEALALVPWSNRLIAPGHVPLVLAVTASALLPLLLVRRSSLLVLQVGLVAAAFWLVGHVASNEIGKASVQVPTSHLADPSWVDAAVPSGAHVAVLWQREPGWSAATALAREHALWRAEFFNWSVERYFYLGTPMHYGLPEAPLRLHAGAAVGFRYWLTASPFPLPGNVIAADPKAGLRLYERVRPAARHAVDRLEPDP